MSRNARTSRASAGNDPPALMRQINRRYQIMSAWIVEQGHIDVLVNALFEYGVVEPGTNARELGQELWHENHRSVNYRYDEDEPTPRYTLTTTEAPLVADAVIYAAGCYDYQSCEHPEWEASRSCRLILGLVAAAEGRGGRDPEYGVYPWGFTSLHEATAPAAASS